MRNRWGQRLENSGFRITRAREIILEMLESTPEHLSAEDIFIRIRQKFPGIGLTTVYRTLDILENAGIVDKFDFSLDRAKYELSEGYSGKKHHHHLICRKCGKIIDYSEFQDSEMDYIRRTESQLAGKHGFSIEKHVIHFYGTCPQCKRM